MEAPTQWILNTLPPDRDFVDFCRQKVRELLVSVPSAGRMEEIKIAIVNTD